MILKIFFHMSNAIFINDYQNIIYLFQISQMLGNQTNGYKLKFIKNKNGIPSDKNKIKKIDGITDRKQTQNERLIIF